MITLALIREVLSVRQRKFAQHGAWMVRAYVIGMRAGTQVLTGIAWAMLVATSGEVARNIVMGSGWVINLIVAERVIQQRLTRRSAKRHLAQPPANHKPEEERNNSMNASLYAHYGSPDVLPLADVEKPMSKDM